MAAKITELPSAATLSTSDLVPVVASSGPTTKQATIAVLRSAITPIVLTTDVSGILPAANGGTGAASLPAGGLAGLTAMAFGDAAAETNAGVYTDAAIVTERTASGRTLTGAIISGASNTITNVAISTAVSGLAAGVATFLTTPSGANLATALTTALPATKGGTGLTSLGANVATFLGTPSGANLASALTTALPDTKGGTGLTALGSGVATFLGTPSSANLAAAVTGETGSGALVFGTSPTLATATNTGAFTTGGVVVTGFTANATAGGTINDCTRGGNYFVEFTNASGPTVTGFDATGVADGSTLTVYAAAATVALTSEGAGSAAANRMTLQGGTTINLPIGCVTQFIYRSSRWRHLAGTAI